MNDLFTELSEPSEPWGAIDTVVWVLSGGDVLKGRTLFRVLSMTQALEWLIIAQRMRDSGA